MPVVSAAWLPSEFIELTSKRMLTAPLPQFFYANMVYMADMRAQFNANPGAFEWMSGRGVPAGVGAPVPDIATMQLMLADTIRSGAIVVSDELASQPGSVVKFNRPVFTGGGYTQAARAIAAGQTISVTPIAYTGEQVPIEIVRYAGPYAANGTQVQPIGVDRFMAKRGIHSLIERTGQQLHYDRDVWLDTVIATLFDSPASGNVLYPNDPNGALSSDAAAFTVGVNGDRTFDYETILRMQAKLQQTNIPTFDDGKYRLVVNPAQAQQLMLDPQFARYAKEDASTNPLRTGFLKSIGTVEVYMSSTNIVSTTAVSGVTINHATMFGKEIVARVADEEGCRVALSTDDNYGETVKPVWIAYEGYGLLDNRFIVTAHSN